MLDLFKLEDDIITNICKVFGVAFLFLAMILTAAVDGIRNWPAALVLILFSIISCIVCGVMIEYIDRVSDCSDS